MTKKIIPDCPLCGEPGEEIFDDYYACPNNHEYDRNSTKEDLKEIYKINNKIHKKE